MGRAILCAAVLMTMGAMTTAASAHSGSPGVNHRQHRQSVRIHEGVRSGELTRGEALRLRHEQQDLRRDERRAKCDGDLTPRERLRLQREQNRASRDIYRLKHNNRDR